MGKIPAGIMGGVKGKVGGVIGASWKGINYIKTYVIPSNPQSTGQQTQRSKMQLAIYIGKLILTDVIQPFWNHLATHMAGFHKFTSVNLLRLDDDEDYLNLLITSGSLEMVTDPAGTPSYYNSGTGIATIDWEQNISGNGQLTDLIGAVIIDTANDVAFSDIGNYTRDDEQLTINIGTGRTASDLISFIWAYSGSLPDLLISNSKYRAVSAA